MPDDDFNPAHSDQLQAFLQDAARIDDERNRLNERRRQQGKLSPEDATRLRQLEQNAGDLVKRARQQGLLLPGVSAAAPEAPQSWFKTAGWGIVLLAGGAIAAIALNLILGAAGALPLLIISFAFIFVIGFLVGREFPHKS